MVALPMLLVIPVRETVTATLTVLEVSSASRGMMILQFQAVLQGDKVTRMDTTTAMTQVLFLQEIQL